MVASDDVGGLKAELSALLDEYIAENPDVLQRYASEGVLGGVADAGSGLLGGVADAGSGLLGGVADAGSGVLGGVADAGSGASDPVEGPLGGLL